MKLLFDENLSRKPVRAVEDLHPGSKHVIDIGLERADDQTVWRHALEHGFTLVSKDADFAERSLSEGPPPKVLWIRRGNCSTRTIWSSHATRAGGGGPSPSRSRSPWPSWCTARRRWTSPR